MAESEGQRAHGSLLTPAESDQGVRMTQMQTTPRGSVADGVYGGAKAVDHIGPPRHPHRVTIMQLARARETYELRWRELVRGDDGAVSRRRRRAPGGNSKAAAYE